MVQNQRSAVMAWPSALLTPRRNKGAKPGFTDPAENAKVDPSAHAKVDPPAHDQMSRT